MQRRSGSTRRALRHLLVAFALLFGQQAAQVHAMAHVATELGGAQKGSTGNGGHPAAQCLAFHAADNALGCASPAPVLHHPEPPAQAFFALPHPSAPRIEFDSRAPPALF